MNATDMQELIAWLDTKGYDVQTINNGQQQPNTVYAGTPPVATTTPGAKTTTFIVMRRATV